MPRINLAKIKSAPKIRLAVLAGLAGLIVAGGLLAWTAVSSQKPATATPPATVQSRDQQAPADKAKEPKASDGASSEVGGEAVVDAVGVKLGNGRFRLETAVGLEEQQKGLSGRSGLEPGTGMLFEAPSEEEFCMWMKDMKFAIDILWLSSDQKIVKVEPDVRPETYPEEFCAVARYVIELPAGAARDNGIRVGQTVEL